MRAVKLAESKGKFAAATLLKQECGWTDEDLEIYHGEVFDHEEVRMIAGKEIEAMEDTDDDDYDGISSDHQDSEDELALEYIDLTI